MKEQDLSLLICQAVGDADLSDTEIPSIDLYLDQILSLISEKNQQSTQRYQGRTLTKTMVNNYSKDGLISPIDGKKYSKAHFVEMLLVYFMKQTLSIDEIKRVLNGVREDCGLRGEDMIRAYHRFLSLKDSNRTRAQEAVHGMISRDGLSVEDDCGFFLTLLDVLSLSAYLKEIGREMLASRYADPVAKEQEKEQQQDEEKRARKAEKKADKLRAKAEKVMAKESKDAKAVVDTIAPATATE